MVDLLLVDRITCRLLLDPALSHDWCTVNSLASPGAAVTIMNRNAISWWHGKNTGGRISDMPSSWVTIGFVNREASKNTNHMTERNSFARISSVRISSDHLPTEEHQPYGDPKSDSGTPFSFWTLTLLQQVTSTLMKCWGASVPLKFLFANGFLDIYQKCKFQSGNS